MKFIDIVLFLNEIDLFLFRKKYLENNVKHFIVGESSETFSGKKKEFVLSNHFGDSIPSNVSIFKFELEGELPFERENFARNKILDYGTRKFPNSFFIFSDLDEIPSISQLNHFLNAPKISKYKTPTFYFSVNLQLQDYGHKNWAFGVLGGANIAELESGGRHLPLPIIDVVDNGCHFSYLSISNNYILQEKMNSYSHVELNFKHLNNSNVFEFAQKYQINHLGKFGDRKHGLLECLRFSKLNEMQKKAIEFNPKFFKLNHTNKSYLKRLYASLILTKLIATNNETTRYILYSTFIQNSSNVNFFKKILVSRYLIYWLLIYLLNLLKSTLKNRLSFR